MFRKVAVEVRQIHEHGVAEGVGAVRAAGQGNSVAEFTEPADNCVLCISMHVCDQAVGALSDFERILGDALSGPGR